MKAYAEGKTPNAFVSDSDKAPLHLYRYFGPSHAPGDVPLILDSGDAPLSDQEPNDPRLAVAGVGLNGMVTIQNNPSDLTATYYANISAVRTLTFSCLIHAPFSAGSSAFGVWNALSNYEIGLYLSKGGISIPTPSGPVTDKWALVYRDNVGTYPQITLAVPSINTLLLAFSISEGAIEYTLSQDWGSYITGNIALTLPQAVRFNQLYSFYWGNVSSPPLELAEMRSYNRYMNQLAREIELDSYRGVWEP